MNSTGMLNLIEIKRLLASTKLIASFQQQKILSSLLFKKKFENVLLSQMQLLTLLSLFPHIQTHIRFSVQQHYHCLSFEAVHC